MFMVVAAAAPLGVIGGVVPLGLASGNGAGFPATFVFSTRPATTAIAAAGAAQAKREQLAYAASLVIRTRCRN